jgi:xanthine dehydrogenase YagT iron-sulfur-binding subunit
MNAIEENEQYPSGTSRREFIAQVASAGIGLSVAPLLSSSDGEVDNITSAAGEPAALSFTVNGVHKTIRIDARSSLLDILRERLSMTGTKKGCDHGQCGACTVLMDGRRVNACLTLGVLCNGHTITTIEGLARGGSLHPVQKAFIKHDAFQCGYCTPGQICSAVGLINEGHARSPEDIREAMSGNICRCGAYDNILSAILDVQQNKNT